LLDGVRRLQPIGEQRRQHGERAFRSCRQRPIFDRNTDDAEKGVADSQRERRPFTGCVRQRVCRC